MNLVSRRLTVGRGAAARTTLALIATAMTTMSGYAQVQMPEPGWFGFGGAVALSGETLVVGAAEGSNGGAVYVYARTGETWTQTDKLTTVGDVINDQIGFPHQFGVPVALDGDTLAVGATGAEVDGNYDQGAVYIFTRVDGTWTPAGKLTASDGSVDDSFGISLALDGDTLVVGASADLQVGAAYVFGRGDDGTWTEVAKLTASDGEMSDLFGSSLAVDGDTLVVGVGSQVTTGGWAYVFTRNGDTWREMSRLVPSDGAVADDFGSSVAVSDDVVVVGAPGPWSEQGAAYVFMQMGDTWTQTAKLVASDGQQHDAFGTSLTLADDTLVVRAADAAYVFSRAGDVWTERATLTASGGPGPAGNVETLGENVTVALDGDALVVGTPPSHSRRGAANVFTGSGDAWTDTAMLTAPFQQHFAEGATGFFQTELALFNPSKLRVANVLVTLNPEGTEGAVEVPLTLQPLGRHTLDLNAAMGDYAGGVSIHVESDQLVAAARQMRWGAAETYGSTLETGAPDTAGTWYFAEGSTYFAQLFYLIANPNDSDANVTIRYLLSTGDPITQQIVVPAHGRRTIWANMVPGLESTEMATVISADRAIVAERSMYVGPQFDAGTTSRGALSVIEGRLFAEGETSFFDTYLLLGNPGDVPAKVFVRYSFPDGTADRTYSVPAGSRRTILVDQEFPELANGTVTMLMSSSQSVFGDRAIWWGGPTSSSWYEGHASLPGTLGDAWAIPEGALGGPNAEDTYVLVRANLPPTSVELTIVRDDGTATQKNFTIPSDGRLTVGIHEHFPDLEGQQFSVLVEGTDITVEYARYQSTGGQFGNAGGAALATLVRASEIPPGDDR